jgi:predicted secreted protein
MAITTAIAIYFLIWWVVLFAVLPWGVRAQGEEGAAGTDPGAPRVPHLKAKLVWTTALATTIFAICAIAYIYRLVTLDSLASLLGTPF